ncbi:MAG TPA: DNA repair exonuclease [Candidatus Avidesulfovibrio excrementigallinarum]|nr:DNA repair exonuclease [Candidatus Avidesulfovibrio excrementigallinarum]
MSTFCFVHAADLHLDAPFRGISQEAPEGVVKTLREASFVALDRLITLCEKEKPAFLLLAGDILNQEEHSARAQLRLLEAFRRLQTAGIPVFMVHGNHDPLGSQFTSIRYPANVKVFGPDYEHCEVKDAGGRLVAIIHGASHASAKETRNLAAQFRRTQDDCPQIGLLHTSRGDVESGDRYAPCTVQDLVASGLDYWALGHVHEACTLCEAPLAVYPGTTQGCHINETGDKGCLLVHVETSGSQASFRLSGVTLGPVVWDCARVELGADDTDAGALEETLQQRLTQISEAARPDCSLLVIRLILEGRTPLDAALRDPNTKEALLAALRAVPLAGTPVWIKDLDVRTRPTLDRNDLLRREDLVGELLRDNDRLRESGLLEDTMREALRPLFGHSRARRALSAPTAGELEELIASAETLCLELLEKRNADS